MGNNDIIEKWIWISIPLEKYSNPLCVCTLLVSEHQHILWFELDKKIKTFFYLHMESKSIKWILKNIFSIDQ